LAMKVLLTAETLLNAYGGVRLYILELARALSARPGVRVSVLVEHADHARDFPDSVERLIVPMPRPPWRNIAYLNVSPRILRGFDVIHVPLSLCPFAISRAATQTPGPPLVMTCHDLIPLVMPEYQTRAISGYYRWWFPRVGRRVSHFVTDSEHTKADMVRVLGVAPERISTVYLGVNSRFTIEPPVLEKQSIFIAVSTVEPRKNFERTVRAFLKFKERNPHYPGSLHIIGRANWTTPELAGYAAAHANEVIIRGHLPDSELHTLYRNATGLIYPSLYEGFGLPVLEAMALGCPVVTSRLTSIPEVGGDAVVYVDPLDVDSISTGIERVALDRGMRNDFIHKGIRRAHAFTWRRCAEDMYTIYERTLAESRGLTRFTVESQHPF
jgi:glycosyltransferase involved in cell wall biosynthesis